MRAPNRRFTIGILVLGAILVAASWLWPQLVGGRRAWSSDDASQLAILQTQLHSLRDQAAMVQESPKQESADRTKVQRINEQLESTEARYKHFSKKLEAAREKGQSMAAVFRWAGIVAIVIGLAGIAAADSNMNGT
jgi:hypothetical protein